MKLVTGLLTAMVVFALALFASAQELQSIPATAPSGTVNTIPHIYTASPGAVFVPKSSQPQAPPAGHKFAAHTNVKMFIPPKVSYGVLPPFPGYGFETPSSLACVYGLTSVGSPTCNPNNTALTVPTGGSKTIAIVDAFDDPSAAGDLAWFSLQFGIPLQASQFQVVPAVTTRSSCSTVPTDYSGGWELEESLDIEYAHAMAPSAKLYLVEACSDYDNDLQQAILVANNLVQCGKSMIAADGTLGTCPAGSTGKGEVSMSWGSGEFTGENGTGCAVTNSTLNDSCFTAPGVVYLASVGDGPGVSWPGTSPNVVSAGGLSTHRSASTFNFLNQTGWVDAGGGQSLYEAQPSYQALTGVQAICGSAWRCVPDLAFNADPYTGVYVYDTFPVEGTSFYEWTVVGGTSLSAPALAGIVNRAGTFSSSTAAELTVIYNNLGNSADFTDITGAWCGYYMGFSGKVGWDFCTGVGAVKGYAGK